MAGPDIPAMMAIENQVNPSPWRAPDFESFLPAAPIPTDAGSAITAAGPERAAWVYADPEVRGFLCAMAVAGEAELQAIGVEQARWGKGAGSALMESLLAWARRGGITAIHLEVREGNRRALDFYARFGFAPVGKRPRYYQDNGEAAILMKRTLA